MQHAQQRHHGNGQSEITYCLGCPRVALERRDDAGALFEVLGARLG